VPVKASIENMLPASQLWPPDSKWNYHCTHSTQAFNTMEVFNTALDARYGTSAGLDDYLMKSGAQQYEAMRPMFEAFRSRIPQTTGIIQWMLNSAWPSFYWQLYDYYLVPVPAYYAVRKANQPVQLIFDYGEQTITAVNESGADIRNYQARIRTFDQNSEPVSDNQQMVNLQAGSAVQLSKPAQVSQVSFLDLELINDENISLGHNFYWLSSVADLPDWQKTTWAYTPMKSYADFTFLQKRKPVSIHPEYTITKTKDGMLVEVWLKNLDNEIAFMNVLALTDEKGDIIRPVFWDDNYLSLLPGETRRVSCKMDKPDQSKKQIQLWLSSWNTPPKSISIPLPQ
jgi:exo-1,4-beta-D-glucosaminidase